MTTFVQLLQEDRDYLHGEGLDEANPDVVRDLLALNFHRIIVQEYNLTYADGKVFSRPWASIVLKCTADHPFVQALIRHKKTYCSVYRYNSKVMFSNVTYGDVPATIRRVEKEDYTMNFDYTVKAPTGEDDFEKRPCKEVSNKTNDPELVQVDLMYKGPHGEEFDLLGLVLKLANKHFSS